MTTLSILLRNFGLLALLSAQTALPANFVSNTATALERGVWEAQWTGTTAGNPFFDVQLHFIFTLPDGNEVKVEGFYRGDNLQNPDGRAPELANVSETAAACGLHLPPGAWRIRWFDPRTGQWHANAGRPEITGGYTRDFKSPFPGDALLLLQLP